MAGGVAVDTLGDDAARRTLAASRQIVLSRRRKLQPFISVGNFTALQTEVESAPSDGATVKVIDIAESSKLTFTTTITIRAEQRVLIRGASSGRPKLVGADMGGRGVGISRRGTQLFRVEGDLVIQNLELTNGNAFYVNRDSSDPYVLADGGAASVFSSSRFAAHNCTMADNRNKLPFSDQVDHLGYGGAVHVLSGARFEAYNCTFSRNFAERRGGAVFVSEGSHFGAHGCTFDFNKVPYVVGPNGIPGAGHGGGAVHVDPSGALFNASDCVFRNNSAGGSGGSVAVFALSRFDASRCSFFGNSATAGFGGGALYSEGASACTDCEFEGNAVVVERASNRAISGDAILHVPARESRLTLLGCAFGDHAPSTVVGTVASCADFSGASSPAPPCRAAAPNTACVDLGTGRGMRCGFGCSLGFFGGGLGGAGACRPCPRGKYGVRAAEFLEEFACAACEAGTPVKLHAFTCADLTSMLHSRI